MASLEFGDEHTHLQAPVAQVYVTQDIMTEEARDAFDALTDDGGAEMSHVHGLGDVGTAVVDHDLLRGRHALDTKSIVVRRALCVCCEKLVGQFEVDEPGTGERYLAKDSVVGEHLRDLLPDLPRVGLVRLCGGERAVALKLSQVGTVGDVHLAVLPIVS